MQRRKIWTSGSKTHFPRYWLLLLLISLKRKILIKTVLAHLLREDLNLQAPKNTKRDPIRSDFLNVFAKARFAWPIPSTFFAVVGIQIQTTLTEWGHSWKTKELYVTRLWSDPSWLISRQINETLMAVLKEKYILQANTRIIIWNKTVFTSDANITQPY